MQLFGRQKLHGRLALDAALATHKNTATQCERQDAAPSSSLPANTISISSGHSLWNRKQKRNSQKPW